MRHRGDEGAITIIVALLMTALVIMAAFAVDFGNAYSTKRQLSIAADAASLASAQQYAHQPSGSSCATLAGDSTLKTSTGAIADRYATNNLTGQSRTGYDVLCASDKMLSVRYDNQKQLSTIFGGLAGVSTITPDREATSAVTVTTQAPGLRPYAMCLADIQSYIDAGDIDAANPPIRTSYFPSPTNDCKAASNGNWYTVDCPGPGVSNGNGNDTVEGSLAWNTKYGCENYIQVIDTSAADDPTTTVDTPAELAAKQAILRSTCDPSVTIPTDPHQCLTANTGNLASGNLDSAWTYLLGKTIAVPVFDKDTVYAAGGNNRIYPVKAIVGIEMCGYHWQNDSHEGLVTTGDCAGAAYPGTPLKPDFLIFKLRTVQFSGIFGAPTCKFGDKSCDLGSRSVGLIK